jgi:putative oxidoreductase
MNVLEATARRAQTIIAALERSDWIPQLLVRLFVGYFFFETGWGKAQNLDAMTERFVGWGIPLPSVSVVLSVYTELIGGALLVVGLGTRLASVPLLINMLVAILTVNIKNVTGLDDFVELDTPLYALFFLWLLFSGPGWVSLDHLLWKRWRHHRSEQRTAASRLSSQSRGTDRGL